MRLEWIKMKKRQEDLAVEFRDFRNFWVCHFCLEAVKEKECQVMERRMPY